MNSSTKTTDFFIKPDWPAPSAVRAFTTLKASKIGVHDEKEKINHTLLKEMLQLPNNPIWMKQIHSDIVLKANEEKIWHEADAIFTDEPNKVCAVLTADCLPILLCDKQGKHVGAIHAGWKGLAKGIIENTIKTLNRDPNDLLIWLGPGIGPHKFEVKKDVFDAFTTKDSEAKSFFRPINSTQWLADLYGLARYKLKKLGISQIYGGNFCTHSEEERFFSYRREGKLQGHIVSVIWLADCQ